MAGSAPCPPEERHTYDLWSGILIAKVLAMYANLSGDGRVEEALYRLFDCPLRVFTRANTLHDLGLSALVRDADSPVLAV